MTTNLNSWISWILFLHKKTPTPTYVQTKIKIFALYTVFCWNLPLLFLFLSEMENKEIYHGGRFSNKCSVFTQ